jgi:carboxypeptidase Q
MSSVVWHCSRSRSRRLGGAAAVSLMLLGTPLLAQPEEEFSEEQTKMATTLRDAALKQPSSGEAFGLLTSLTTEVGPRLAGSAGDAAAVAWAVKKMTAMGFSNVHSEPVTVPHWVRGAASAAVVSPFPQPLSVVALAGSVATLPAGITAAVVSVSGSDALERLEATKIKGAIVFVDVPTERTRDNAGFIKALTQRADILAKATAKGAAAVLVRSNGTDVNRLPHTGPVHYAKDSRKIPVGALSHPDSELLIRMLAGGQAVKLHLVLESKSLAPAKSANVIGDIVGREKPNEIVLLTCHLDSWDLGQGALDDGAGCAVILDAAHRLGQLKQHPRRTVRVVLFADSLMAGSGAGAYAAAHAADLNKTVVAMEANLGAGRPYRLSSLMPPESLGYPREVARTLAVTGMSGSMNNSEGGPDLLAFAPARVPLIELDQDLLIYYDFQGTANDTLDKANARDLDYAVAAYVTAAYLAADKATAFGRVPEAAPELPPQ